MIVLLEILLVLALMVVNGLLAMSEIAVVTARRGRLTSRAESGDGRAATALELASQPTQFLSTVQIGITLVGIVAGAIGGATLARHLVGPLSRVPVIGPHAEGVAFTLVVALITYLSLILGELVPKRIALANPERVASLVARPMRILSRVASPLVRLLTASTNALVRPLGLHRPTEATVTDEDVRALVAQGRATGTIPAGEEEIVERVLRLGDRPAAAIMTPRTDLEWIELDEDQAVLRRLLLDGRHALLLVCRDSVDDVVGVVVTRDLLRQCVEGKTFDLRAALKQPLFVPETTPVLRLLELFRPAEVPAAVVLDEFGGVQGLATVSDIFGDLVGELRPPGAAPRREAEITPRPEGGWLVDGGAPVEDLEEELGLTLDEEERKRDYRTVGGLVLTHLGHLPMVGEFVEVRGFRFEVVDMDGRRIDRLLVAPAPEREATGQRE